MPSKPPSELSPSSSGSSTDEEITATTLSKKRKKSLTKACKKKGKRRKSAYPLRPYTQFSRWYTRSQNIEVNWFEVFEKGMAYDNLNYGKLTRSEFLRKYQKVVEVYRDIQAGIPCFEKESEYLEQNPNLCDSVAKAMLSAMSAARSEDISSLNTAALIYTAAHEADERLNPPIKIGAPKSGVRGHNHVQLSRKLCPAKYLADFDRDPEEFRKKLLRGKVAVRSRDWPSFLWPNGGYDPDHLSDGLLRNPVLVMVFKHIFTCPSSATAENTGTTATKPSQAKSNGMKSVMYGSIAYACTLYRFVISDITDWRINDRLYNWRELYDNVVDIMASAEEDDPEWLKDLLEWWNMNIFGADPSIYDASDAETGPSSMSILAKQRIEHSRPDEDPRSTPPFDDINEQPPVPSGSQPRLDQHDESTPRGCAQPGTTSSSTDYRPAGFLPTPAPTQYSQPQQHSPPEHWSHFGHNQNPVPGPSHLQAPSSSPVHYHHPRGLTGRGPITAHDENYSQAMGESSSDFSQPRRSSRRGEPSNILQSYNRG